MSIEAMKQALEALTFDGFTPQDVTHRELTAKAVEALRAAIQQAEAKTDERAAFEAEMRCECVWGHRSLKKRPDGRYQNWQVDLMWDVWKARAQVHPAQAGVPDDVARDAQRYRWLRRKACVIGKTTYCGEETGQPILDFVNLPDVTEVIRRDSASTLDAAIDAAMLTAAQAQKGEP